MGLRLAVAIAAAFRSGGRPQSAAELADGLGAPPRQVRELLAALAANGLLLEIGNGDAEPGYVPARDPQEIKVAELVEVLRRRDGARLGRTEESSSLAALLEEAERSASEVLGRTDLRSLALQLEETSPR